MPYSIKSVARTFAIQILVFLCGLLAIELLLRHFLPLPAYGGEYLDANGAAVRIARDDNTLNPRLDVRHVSAEFSARIRTDDLGYRRMSNENATPQFLFLGDSFTFGHGVADDEVFSELFCTKRGAACLNLGRSGTNTFDQVRLLRFAIDKYRVRPKTVVVTILAACWLGVAGGDLGDNLTFYRNAKQGDLNTIKTVSASLQPPFGPSLTDGLRALQSWLSDFELTKRAMIVFAAGLKRSLYQCSAPADLDAAGNATAAAFGELSQLAEEYGFNVKVVVIHPFQDLAVGFRVSEAVVGRALPKTFGCVPTGSRFRADHYFSYDGHFNAPGHANLARILESTIDSAPNGCAPTP